MHCFVTGCAGFIGSTLTDRLLQAGHTVSGIDNFSTGLREFLTDAEKNPHFKLTEGDLLDNNKKFSQPRVFPVTKTMLSFRRH